VTKTGEWQRIVRATGLAEVTIALAATFDASELAKRNGAA